MALLFFGSLVFGYGVLGTNTNYPVLGWVMVTVGLTMALRGTASVAVDLLIERLTGTREIEDLREYLEKQQQSRPLDEAKYRSEADSLA